jgi:hypothetical protein
MHASLLANAHANQFLRAPDMRKISLEDDVLNKDGNMLILKRGSVLTGSGVERRSSRIGGSNRRDIPSSARAGSAVDAVIKSSVQLQRLTVRPLLPNKAA